MKRGLVLLLLLTAAVAINIPYADEAPPPERIVRTSFVGGDTSYLRGDAEEWTALGLNTPLMTGDSLYAGDGARAEVSLGRGSFARLGDGTQVDLVSLTGSVTQLGVDSGLLSLRVATIPEGGTIEVDTPSASATIDEPGLYKISVDDQHAMFDAVSGGMSVLLSGEQLDLDAGDSLSIAGTDQPTYEYGRTQPPTSFDRWAASRDNKFDGSRSREYVNRNVEGTDDLDDYGTWRPDPRYGRVWMPSHVAADWAPYQDGRWMWQDPYGWTWVSYEPWGWAPYHYGRWVSISGTWGWVPPPPAGYVAPRGVIMPQPVYAPALVAFVGGSNWSVGVSLGGPAVGWVPLAPSERYYYPWQPAPTRRVVYKNVTVVNAVTVVNVNNFSSGGRHRVRVKSTYFRHAPVMGCAPRGIQPSHASLSPYPERHLGPGAIPAHRAARRALVTRLVPPPRPTPFRQKEMEIRRTGRPIARPVAYEGDVGKPFHRGARVPKGVSAVSAIAPDRPVRLRARPGGEGGHFREPRHIERDILPRPGRSEAAGQQGGRQAEPGRNQGRGAGPNGTPPGQETRRGEPLKDRMNRMSGQAGNRGNSATPDNGNRGNENATGQRNQGNQRNEGTQAGNGNRGNENAPGGQNSGASPAPEKNSHSATETGNQQQPRRRFIPRRGRPAPPSRGNDTSAGGNSHPATEGNRPAPPIQKAGTADEQAHGQAQGVKQQHKAEEGKKKHEKKKNESKKKGKKGKNESGNN